MEEWVKLFKVDGRTVLYFLEPDGDDVTLHVVTREDDIFVDVKLNFINDMSDKSGKYFAGLTEDDARRALKLRDDTLA